MAEQIALHQALFGYRDGHNLLATSATLPPRARQFLATISDSSGPEANKGFEGMFTGLPVPETDFYAVFCTWSAPEMPRPGCVWSHVILVPLVDLARIPELAGLQNLFSRPSVPVDTARYAETINFQTDSPLLELDSLDHERLHSLLRLIYEHPKTSVVVLDTESAPWARVLFSIWTQQWPRLRREFAFSTGSLGDRRLAGVPFDVQIAPRNTERLWRRTGDSTCLVDFRSTTISQFSDDLPDWIQVAEADLLHRDRRFRQFLFDCGSDIEDSRAAFAKLANVFTRATESSSPVWTDLLQTVATQFPIASEAVRLKRWLIDISTPFDSSQKLERAWAVVSFLLSSEQSCSYSISDVTWDNAAAALWREKRDETTDLISRLVQRKESPSAIAFAAGVARSVDITSLKLLSESHSELVPIMIRHNFPLAYESDTWKLGWHIQTQIFETLKQLDLGHSEWGAIVGAMFIAATSEYIRASVALAGEEAMIGAFRWLDDPISVEVLPSQPWREALAMPAIRLLAQRTDLKPAELALASWCAPISEVRRVLTTYREDVQRLSDTPEGVPYPLRIPTCFLLITIGLRESSDSATEIVLKNFFSVHEALAARVHSSDSWALLAPELPTLGWWRDWDLCERLRRAVYYYLAQRHSTQRLFEFANTANERRIVQKVIDSANVGDA